MIQTLGVLEEDGSTHARTPDEVGEATRRYAESSYVPLRDSVVPAAAHRFFFVPSADDRVGVTNRRQSNELHTGKPQIVQRRQYQTLNQGSQTTDRPRETRTLNDDDETHPIDR